MFSVFIVTTSPQWRFRDVSYLFMFTHILVFVRLTDVTQLTNIGNNVIVSTQHFHFIPLQKKREKRSHFKKSRKSRRASSSSPLTDWSVCPLSPTVHLHMQQECNCTEKLGNRNQNKAKTARREKETLLY